MTTAMLNIGTKHWKTAYKKAEAENKELKSKLAALAAAEAGEIKPLPEPELPAGHTPEWHIIDATIERCAQVAENMLAYDDDLQKSAGCLPTGKRIAAAIRALKEKP